MLHHNISHYKISVIISNGTLGVPLGYDENQTDNSKNVLKYTETYDHWHTVYVHDHHRQARYYRRASRTKFRILPPTPPLARHFIVQQATTHHHRRRESGLVGFSSSQSQPFAQRHVYASSLFCRAVIFVSRRSHGRHIVIRYFRIRRRTFVPSFFVSRPNAQRYVIVGVVCVDHSVMFSACFRLLRTTRTVREGDSSLAVAIVSRVARAISLDNIDSHIPIIPYRFRTLIIIAASIYRSNINISTILYLKILISQIWVRK